MIWGPGRARGRRGAGTGGLAWSAGQKIAHGVAPRQEAIMMMMMMMMMIMMIMMMILIITMVMIIIINIIMTSMQ